MVSARRWITSPTSSCSSCDDNDKALRSRNLTNVDQSSIEDEREVAKRVLEDLEGLYFNSDSDQSSEDEDDDSSSENDSVISSSRKSQTRKSTNCMTLEELTVAVNAAIEYHRPVKTMSIQSIPKTRMKTFCSKKKQRSSTQCCAHEEEEESIDHVGDSAIEIFQALLKKREKNFYHRHLTAKEKTRDQPNQEIDTNRDVRDNPSQEIGMNRNVSSNQHQQTAAKVRDQATGTDDNFHEIIKDDTSLDDYKYDVRQSARIESSVGGPTIADLVDGYRRGERLWSVSSFCPSSSSENHTPLSQSHSSISSVNDASSRSSGNNSRSSGNNSRRSGSRSRITNNKVAASRNPSVTSRSSHFQTPMHVKTTSQNNDDNTSDMLSKFEVITQTQSNPMQVNWELDLSNFAF